MSPQRIVPCLWLNDCAEELAEFYISVFPNSKVVSTTQYPNAGHEFHGHEPGSVLTVEFEVLGYRMTALNGGSDFEINPAISFSVTSVDPEVIDTYWERLRAGGEVLMELGKYDWAEKYGWLKDRFGVSWQLGVWPEDAVGSAVSPTLMFCGEHFGEAEAALNRYTEIFEDSKIEGVMKVPDSEAVMHAQCELAGQTFAVMDSDGAHDFTFNEAVSFQVMCDSQDEIDRYWDALTADGGSPGQCGWLNDRFGVTWQVVPRDWFLGNGDPFDESTVRAANAMFSMQKLDLKQLADAAAGTK